jgi:hypothetical protein
LLLLLNSKKSKLSLNKLEEKVGILIYEQFDTNDKIPIDLLFADEHIYLNSTRSDFVYYQIKKDGVTLYE